MVGYGQSTQERLALISAFKTADLEVARIEDELTDFRPSPFNEINRYAGIKPVPVSDEIQGLVHKALQISEASKGAFDISYAAVGHLWRTARQSGCLPAKEEIEAQKRFVDYRRIVVDADASTVYLPHPRMRIGFGGVGKGYAVDQAFEIIKSKFGLTNFMINGAGDIRVSCAADAPRPWIVRIRNPFGPPGSAAGMMTVRGGAVATSGDYERFMMNGDQRLHHVIDARTCSIRQDVASVTICAPTALEADLCATAAMALGPNDGLRFIESRRGIRGTLIDRTGQVYTGRGWVQESPSVFKNYHVPGWLDSYRASI